MNNAGHRDGVYGIIFNIVPKEKLRVTGLGINLRYNCTFDVWTSLGDAKDNSSRWNEHIWTKQAEGSGEGTFQETSIHFEHPSFLDVGDCLSVCVRKTHARNDCAIEVLDGAHRAANDDIELLESIHTFNRACTSINSISGRSFTLRGSVFYRRVPRIHLKEDETPEGISKKRLCNMWNTMIFSDAIVKCNGRTWDVHRSILACASPVMRRMFESGFVEGHTATIEIHDAEPASVAEFLEFLYTGFCPLFAEEPKESAPRSSIQDRSLALLSLASLYDVEDLAKTCCKFLWEANLVDESCFILFVQHLRHHRDQEVQDCLLEATMLNSKLEAGLDHS